VIVCGERIDYAYDDLYYLERACRFEVLARATGAALAPADATLAARVAAQVQGEREQAILFFEALRRTVPAA
jgi:ribulose-5-phosphate 4-epimerase/fuculose-1-phosphate aldolase